ncbi:MAG: DUF192 domain-containing protein [Maribacter sp.]
MKNLKIPYLVLCCLFLILSCKEESKNTMKVAEVAFTQEGTLAVFKKGTDSLKMNFNIEFAESDYETQTGLMYRKGMNEDEAMLFIFPEEAMHSFYMKNTQFPLDIIYIDKGLKVVSMQENAEPFNEEGLSSKQPVTYVLEINGGLAKTKGIQIGDSIHFSRQ